MSIITQNILKNGFEGFNMELRNKYLVISAIIVIALIILFIMFSFIQNQLNFVFNILAVLIGSSITILFALILEDKRFEQKKEDIISSIAAEITYNLETSEQNLVILENEIKKIENGIIDKNEFYVVPLHSLKTDKWDLLKIDYEEKILGKDLQKILDITVLTEDIADLFRIRENIIIFRDEVNPLFIKHYNTQIIAKLELLIKITKEFLNKV